MSSLGMSVSEANEARVTSQTACLHCRAQKIRCSRLLPICSRCLRRDLPCKYPEPPNRRLLASGRDQIRKSCHNSLATEQHGCADFASHLSPKPDTLHPLDSSSWMSHEILQSRNEMPNDLAKAPLPADCLPSVEVGLFLIEVYFSRVFSASLLFDRKAFIEDYRASKLFEPVLLGVLALATMFLQPRSESAFAKETGLAPFSSLNKKGKVWAEMGSRLALVDADKPTFDTVRACELFGFYWWATGELERVTIHFGVSREALRVLHRRACFGRRSGLNLAKKEFQTIQRLRQACWIKLCLNDLDEWCHEWADSYSSEQFDEFSVSSLPSVAEYSEYDIEPNDWLTWDEYGCKNSTLYCVQLHFLWREIRNLVRQSWNKDSPGYINKVFELDLKLQKLYRSLPTELKGAESVGGEIPERRQLNAFYLNSIYYLCVIYLHASAVPGISGSRAKLDISDNLAEFCGRTALLNASHFATMARQYLATVPDFSKLPSFVGYCAFIAGSVHVVALRLHDYSSSVSSWGHRGSIVCCLILQELKLYYPILTFLWQELKAQLHTASAEDLEVPAATVRALVFSTTPSSPEQDARIVPPLSKIISKSPLTVNEPFILRRYISPTNEEDGQERSRETPGMRDYIDSFDWVGTRLESPGNQVDMELGMVLPSTPPCLPSPRKEALCPPSFAGNATNSISPEVTGQFSLADFNPSHKPVTSADLFGLPTDAIDNDDLLAFMMDWEFRE